MATQNSNSNGTQRSNGELKDTIVSAQTSQGTEIHATLVRMTRHSAVFEIYNLGLILRVSEVLTNFKSSSTNLRCTPSAPLSAT